MLVDNHSSDAVPEKEQVSAFHVAQVYIGIAITLPAFLVSAQVFSSLGFQNGLLALAISGLALFLLAMLTMVVGAKTRLSTYAIIENVFGSLAAVAINILLLLVLLGWFAVTVALFADALSSSLEQIIGTGSNEFFLKLVGGLLMTVLTLYGFRAIDRLSRLVVPLLMLVLLVQLVLALQTFGLGALWRSSGTGDAIGDVGTAVSIMVGAFMVGVTITPDVARFSRSVKQAVLASFLSFGFGVQLVFFFAGVPAIATGNSDFVGNMTAFGLGWPALFVVIFATLTTNINNLYSVSLGLGKTFGRLSDFQVTATAGGLGTIFALLGFEDVFVPFLIFLSIAIPPIAGVYVMQILLFGGLRKLNHIRSVQWTALSAWVLGSVGAFATSEGWFILTNASALDGILISALFYHVLSHLQSRIMQHV